MKQSTKQTLRLILSLLLIGTNIGCGAAKSANQDQGSKTPWGAPVGQLAECNLINSNSFGLGGVISSYYDPGTRSYRDDLGRIYFKQVPADIATHSTKSLQIFRWQINTANGQPVLQTTPVSLVFVLRSTGQVLNSTSPVSTLSQSTITTIINTYSLGALGINPSNFFQQVIMISSGLSLQDNAYRVSYFDSSVGATPQASVDILMPPFTADPGKYQQSHPYQALYQLHPLNSMGYGLPESSYVNAALTYCQQFFN